MKKCPFCDSSNSDSATICQSCGIVFSSWEGGEAAAERSQVGIQKKDPYLDRYSNGGLIAWSVITMLLCLIPGLVGLIYAVNINSSSTHEEQEHKAGVSCAWCLAGTILGLIALVIRAAAH